MCKSYFQNLLKNKNVQTLILLSKGEVIEIREKKTFLYTDEQFFLIE